MDKKECPVIVFMGYGPLEGVIKEASEGFDNIFLHDAVDPMVLLDYTSSADCGFAMIEPSCLSYEYCLPNKLFEYQMAGIPFIASNLTEMAAFLKVHKTGLLVEQKELKCFEDAIKEMSCNSGKFEENIDVVRKIYNWEEQEKKLLNTYTSLGNGEDCRKEKVLSIVLNNFKNDSRVLKENISLQNSGYEIQVLALHEGDLHEFDFVQGIPVHRIKLKTRLWSKKKIIQIVKYLEFVFRVVKKYKNYEIIHCNDLNTLPIGVLIKKIFNRRIKVVYDAHEYEINCIPNQSNISVKLNFLLEKVLIKYADKVITVSDSIAQEYRNLYGIEKPVVILNAPNFKVIQKKNIFREVFPIGDEQPIFLYQGGLCVGRGIETLLEIFKKLNKKNEDAF